MPEYGGTTIAFQVMRLAGPGASIAYAKLASGPAVSFETSSSYEAVPPRPRGPSGRKSPATTPLGKTMTEPARGAKCRLSAADACTRTAKGAARWTRSIILL